MRAVRQERTGWRDLQLSERHRKWGFDCPAVDIDFLLIEYDKGKPTAIVEYKHEEAPKQWTGHPSYRAMIRLGTDAGIPVFAARYSSDFSTWRVTGLNKIARTFLTERETMDERQFVTFLYKVRGITPPDDLFDGETIRI